MNIEDKSVLRDDIFIDNEGKLYVIHKHNIGLFPEIPDSLKIDKESIRHLVDNYYYDKNKVYFLDYYSCMEDERPVSRFAKTLGEYKNNYFRIGASYFTVNDQVYLRSDRSIMPLDLDALSVKEYLLDNYYMTYLITDGEKVYISSKHYQGTEFSEITSLRGLQLQGVLTGSSIWKYDSTSKMVYLSEPAKLPAQNIKEWQGQLMISQINRKAFIVDRDGKVLTFNGIMVSDDKRLFGNITDIWSGKNILPGITPLAGHLLADECYAVLSDAFMEKGIDKNKITRVGESIFYTDSRHLILMDEIWRVNKTYSADGHILLKRDLNNWICSINKPEKLKIINNNILTDGETLYYIADTALMATPITDLGIPVFYLEKGSAKITKSDGK